MVSNILQIFRFLSKHSNWTKIQLICINMYCKYNRKFCVLWVLWTWKMKSMKCSSDDGIGEIANALYRSVG